jgi:hypothetical protein
MVNPREHRTSLFDDMTSLFRDMQLTLSGFQDPTTTAKQRRAITKAQKELLQYEQRRIKNLRKTMGIP